MPEDLDTEDGPRHDRTGGESRRVWRRRRRRALILDFVVSVPVPVLPPRRQVQLYVVSTGSFREIKKKEPPY